MRNATALGVILAWGLGCASDPFANEKTLCADLFGEGSDAFKSCVVELVANRQPQNPQRTTIIEPGPSEQQIRETYRQERMREQILQHGAGGCTPNFATGGCL